LQVNSPHSQHKALVDSGVAVNFIDRSFAHSLGIPNVLVAKPFPVHALDSQPIASRLIREATTLLGMVTQGGHKERISLFLIDSPAFPMVLGLPWLACHDPTVSWQRRALTRWLRECSCVGVSVGATTVESPDQVSTMRIPTKYFDLALAFSKKKATQLPPHRWGTCAINLQVDAALPRCHVYPLSHAETLAMETYFSKSLCQGYIRSSTSPASSSFSVVWELDTDIEQALSAEPAPFQCPAGHLYIPPAVCDRLIYWADTSPSSGHPGIGRTVRCLSGK
jgi:hypothetical protein